MYYIKGHGWVRILSSARKHGVADGDMVHAIGQAVVVMVMDSGPRGRTLFVGADGNGRPLRRKFERYLTQGGAS